MRENLLAEETNNKKTKHVVEKVNSDETTTICGRTEDDGDDG